MYVAVVMTKDGISHRPGSGFAAFIGTTKDDATKAALYACDEWKRKNPHRGYHVLVGELIEEAVRPNQWAYEALTKRLDECTEDGNQTREELHEELMDGVRSLFSDLRDVLRDELGIELEDVKITKMR